MGTHEWVPPWGFDPAKYKTGPVFELFAAFEPHGGKSPRTKAAHVDGLRALLRAAIVGGMKWTRDDAKAIAHCFSWEHGQYRFRVDEDAYTDACQANNVSACVSMEKYFGRSPWFWPGLAQAPHGGRSGYDERVGVGYHVRFEDGWWVVTSLHDDRITICAYEDNTEGWGRKLIGRRTLSRDDVTALRAA